MPLGPINQIAITTGPRPTHGGYFPPALHQPANHTQTNSSAYPRALERGGRRRRTPPTTTTITGNTSTRTQTIKSGQLTLLNPSPRHHKTTLPLLIIGDCHLVRQHPLSLPTRGFRNNGGLDLSGLGILALPPPDSPYVAMPLDCGGQPPQTWHDDLCGFFETLFQRRVDGLKPASTCRWTVPRAQALLRGRAWVAQLWVKSVVGRSFYGPYPFLWCNRGVAVAV